MLPEATWWRGNPHYDALWRTTTPQERLQRQVLEQLLAALPETAARALLEELLAARHPGQVQVLRTAELTQGLIDVVLAAAAQQAATYRLAGQEVALVPLERLQQLADPDWRQSQPIHGASQP